MTYSSKYSIKSGFFVVVLLKNREYKAVVIKEVEKPVFACEEIVEVKDIYLTNRYMKIAKFISEYYVCSLGEAFGVFVPFKTDIKTVTKEIKVKKPSLTSFQKEALNFIEKRQFSLLFGETGSGKTEIYISLIADFINANKSAIFLMPEISLTPQMEMRLREYFGETLAIWHSKVSKKRKEKILEGIYKGDIKIVAGARSALFLPMKNLGIIVVDEEHDSSYKSNSKPRYNAKDMSLYLGKILSTKVVLGSATPSLTSYYKIEHYRLKERFVKSKKEFLFVKNSNDIEGTIIKELQNILKNSKQAIVFLPTRANFKYISCFECGEIIKCPFCSVGMSLHKKLNALKCHYCGYTERIPEICPKCKSKDLNSFRMGTEEIKERLSQIFPTAVVEKFDRDAIKSEKKLKEVLKSFNDKKIDILVGTQMLSKGHDYSDIELSVILGIDSLLAQNDFKARENALSLSLQIAGRSGRGGRGKVIVQTSNENFFKKYMDDYELFLKDELRYREDLYPPYKKLLRILILHKDKQKAKDLMYKAVDCLTSHLGLGVEIVGYGESVIEKIAGKYRYDILLRASSAKELLQTISFCKKSFMQIDMDPLSFS